MFKPFLKKWSFLFKLRLFSGLLLLALILVFAWLKIVPGGRIVYTRAWPETIKSGKGFIYNFSPGERIDASGGRLKIIGDPVYFSLFTPRTFSRAKLTVKYRDQLTSETPIIEAGVLVDKIVWRYDLKPISNQVLDNWPASWKKIKNGSTTLWQIGNDYASLEKFADDLKAGKLKNCPSGPTGCLALYNHSADFNYILPGVKIAPAIINYPTRGAQQFFIYLGLEPLALDFNFIDLNQNRDQDPITVSLSAADKIIATRFLDDNNSAPESGQPQSRAISFHEDNLPPGVYKVEIKADDDIITKKIISSTNKLSYSNKIWPVSGDGDLTLYTDADYLQVKAINSASLQTIVFDGRPFNLRETYKQFNFRINSAAPVKAIKLKQDDIILETDGVFAWSPDSLFNPGLKRINRYSQGDKELKYILADYEAPLDSGGLKEATAEFNLVGAYRENGKYSFMISIPGLDGGSGYLEIEEIKIELAGRSLGEKIKSLISR